MRIKDKYILLIFLTFIQKLVTAQVNDSIDDLPKLTPFNPKATYETIGIKARVLPWTIGNSGGLNVLFGIEYGFLKNHSLSIDGYFYGTEDHHDNYYGTNDPRNRDSDDYGGFERALFFNYNYYFNMRELRDECGLSLYSGVNSRIGKASYSWDRGISHDSILVSEKKYYSFGPQIGIIYNWKKKNHFAINLNVTGLYNVKKIYNTTTSDLIFTSNTAKLRTYDLKVGINLYWWFIRKRK